jgi:hypothetical protein
LRRPSLARRRSVAGSKSAALRTRGKAYLRRFETEELSIMEVLERFRPFVASMKMKAIEKQ